MTVSNTTTPESMDLSIRKSCFHLTPIQNGLTAKNYGMPDVYKRQYIYHTLKERELLYSSYMYYNDDSLTDILDVYKRQEISFVITPCIFPL